MGRDIIARSMASGAIKVNINAGHIFVDNTARDAYFVTNPTELVENMYVYCNSKLQQYVNSAWVDRSAVVQGGKGDKGDNGITPHIGINGNWYIGITDTGVKAVGVDGVNGTNGINGADGVGVQTVIDNGDNTFTVTLTNGAFTIIDKIDTINSDVITQGTTNLFFTTTEKNKLTSIEENAEVNNISDTNATDLTDSGDTTLHYHASDRDRTNHTGTQAISTITGLQTSLDSKTNKDFTTYTQKSTVSSDDKIAINDSEDTNSVKYVTLNQLVSSVQDPHNKGYFETGTALNTAIPTANDGDFAVVGATNTVWVWSTASSDFVDSGANGAVASVNGRTGIVTLTKADVGLNNVVNLDTSTTANITDSLDKRFVTDANLVVIGNTSGTNTGDETNATIKTKLGTDLTNKVDKVMGKSLISDTEITRLATVVNYDDTSVQSHMSNTDIHVTAEDKTAWNNKADSTELTAHTGNADIHVTAEDKAAWNDALGVQISDNETVEDKTWSSSKIASEIPTTLPANGGNADTVNNHTVKSDVPENAVFTDTVYDDTELKGSIAEINSKLVDRDTIATLPIPTKEKTYFVQKGDNTFPYLYGKLQISYGSYTGEYVALYQTTGVDNECYINTYLTDHWRGWKKLLSQSI